MIGREKKPPRSAELLARLLGPTQLTSPWSLSACRLPGLLLAPQPCGLSEGTGTTLSTFWRRHVQTITEQLQAGALVWLWKFLLRKEAWMDPTLAGHALHTCWRLHKSLLTFSWQSLQDAAAGCGQVRDGLPLLLGRICCFWEDYEGEKATFIQSKSHISALRQTQKSRLTQQLFESFEEYFYIDAI